MARMPGACIAPKAVQTTTHAWHHAGTVVSVVIGAIRRNVAYVQHEYSRVYSKRGEAGKPAAGYVVPGIEKAITKDRYRSIEERHAAAPLLRERRAGVFAQSTSKKKSGAAALHPQ